MEIGHSVHQSPFGKPRRSIGFDPLSALPRGLQTHKRDQQHTRSKEVIVQTPKSP